LIGLATAQKVARSRLRTAGKLAADPVFFCTYENGLAALLKEVRQIWILEISPFRRNLRPI